MAVFAVLSYAFLVVVAVVVVWTIVHRRRPVELPARIAPAVAAARRRAVVSLAFAVVVLTAGAVAGLSFPSLLGMPLAAAPLVAAAAGLLLYAATPPRAVEVADGEVRSANLTPRSWRTVMPRRWLRAGAEIIVMFLVIVVFCGVTARVDDRGRSRVIGFETADQSSSASPYPGWFYGIPALIALAVLVGAALVALQRIGATAAFPHVDDTEADLQWRTASASTVLKLAVGAMLFSLGGIAMIAGQAMGNAVIEGATPVVWSVVSSVLLLSGIVFLVVSIVSVTLAALTAFTIGERLVRVPAATR